MPRIILSQGHVAKLLVCSIIISTVIITILTPSLSSNVQKNSVHVYDSFTSGARAVVDGRYPWQPFNETAAAEAAAQAPSEISEETAYLRYLMDRFDLASDIPWFARRIQPNYDAASHDRPSLTKVSTPFLSHGFVKVHLDEDAVRNASAVESMYLPVEPTIELPMGRSAHPDEIDASSMLFGISTTYARLANSNFAMARDWARWLTDGNGHSNGAKLVLSLHRAAAYEEMEVDRELQKLGIDVAVFSDTDYKRSEPQDNKKKSGKYPGKQFTNPDVPESANGHLSPEPATVRYANLLPLMVEYHSNVTSTTTERQAPAEAKQEKQAKKASTKGSLPAPLPVPAKAAVPAAAIAEAQTLNKVAQKMEPPRSFFVMADDDVFFPSMDRLIGKLSEYNAVHHPHTSRADDLWLGLPSDASDWLVVDEDHEHQTEANRTLEFTYGGGAVVMAPSLASRVAELPCLSRANTDSVDEAMDEAAKLFNTADQRQRRLWDEKLYRCVSTQTPARLRVLPSLYTPSDALMYSLTGMTSEQDNDHAKKLQQLSGGLQPLAIHPPRKQTSSIKGLHSAPSPAIKFPAGAGHQVTSVCGEDCFLQRFLFGDGWVLVNGHSLARYPTTVASSLRTTGSLRGLPTTTHHKAMDYLASGPHAVDENGIVSAESFWSRLMSYFGSTSSELTVESIRESLEARHRWFDKQQAYWSGKKLIVDDADQRPETVDTVESTGPPHVWHIVDSRTAKDGSIWQAYIQKKTPSVNEQDNVNASEAVVEADSVVVLIWEAPKE